MAWWCSLLLLTFGDLREGFKLKVKAIAVQRLSASGKGVWTGHTSHRHYFWGSVYISLGWLLGPARAVTAAVCDSLPPLSLNGCQCDRCTQSSYWLSLAWVCQVV